MKAVVSSGFRCDGSARVKPASRGRFERQTEKHKRLVSYLAIRHLEHTRRFTIHALRHTCNSRRRRPICLASDAPTIA